MNTNHDDERMVFSITAEDVQDIAVSMLERRLTNYGCVQPKNVLNRGCLGIDIVFKAAIETAVER